MIKRKDEFSFKELVGIFLPKLWIIIIVAFVFGMSASLYAIFLVDDTYTSTAEIHVVKDSAQDFNSQDIMFSTDFLQTYMHLISVSDFRDTVFGTLKNNLKAMEQESKEQGITNVVERYMYLTDADALPGAIATSTIQDILVVQVTTDDPVLSRLIAEAISSVITDEEGTLLAYPKNVVSTREIQAPKDGAKNSHQVLLHAIIGVAVGTILSMGVIFIFDLLDVVIHDKKKIEENFDIPVLGVIPRFVSDEERGRK